MFSMSSSGTRSFHRARRSRGAAAALGVAALAIVAAACGNGDNGSATPSSSTGSSAPAATGSITVGGANFTEMLIMEQVYALALKDAGFDTTVLSVDNRENYETALESGEIDVVPEYAATMAEFLNAKANGTGATPVASGDVGATVDALTTLAESYGLKVLDVSEAADENAFVVTQEFSDTNNVTTLSQLGALGQPITLAAAPECPDRPFCQPGLESTYGLNITKLLPLGYGGVATLTAVKNGEAQLGLTGTTDGTLGQYGLVALEDDKNLQNADNLIPVVNAKTLADYPQIADVLNAVSAALTTDLLAAMDLKVDAERRQPEEVAREFLQNAGLID